MSLIFSIILLSVLGIVAIFVLISHILKTVYYIPHIDNHVSPTAYKTKYQEFYLETHSEKKIHMWELEADKTGPILLAVHGWSHPADTFLPLTTQIKDLAHCFLISTRNHGKSDREKTLSHVKFKQDILVAIRYLNQKFPKRPLILAGHSFSSGFIIEQAQMLENVHGLILFSLFTNGEELVRNEFIRKKMPRQLTESFIHSIEARSREKLSNIAPEDIVGQVKIPVLMLHGKDDKVVSQEEILTLKEKLNPKSVAYRVENADHNSVLGNQAAIDKVRSFIKKLKNENS